MATLLATLRAASGIVSAFTTVTGLGSNTPATAAKLKDSLDTTWARGIWVGDGVDADVGTYSEDWTIDVATPPAGRTWNISKVTVRARAARVQTAGVGVIKVRPRVNSIDRGTLATATTSQAWYDTDFTTDPADALAWTVAKLNAQKFGFLLDCTGTDVDAETRGQCAELSIEVWGAQETLVEPATADADTPGQAQETIVNPAEASAETPELIDDSLMVLDTYQPQEITSLGSILLRSTNPANLGDADALTGNDSGKITTVEASSPRVVTAIDIANTPDQSRSISYIIIKAMGGHNVGLGPETYKAPDETRFFWDLGTQQHNVVIPADFGNFTAGGGLLYNTILETDPQPLHPGGFPWEWGAVNAIKNVAVKQYYDVLPGEYFHLNISEIWIEVYGEIGGADDDVSDKTTQKVGHTQLDTNAGPDRIVFAESGVIKLKTQTGPDVGP